MAYQAVTKFGMFGDDLGYMSTNDEQLSDKMKSEIDLKVKQILEQSEQRVEKLLTQKGSQMRELSKNLYWYDYLNADEMDQIFNGKKIDKERVRQWDDG